MLGLAFARARFSGLHVMAMNCIRALEALAFVSLARNLTCVLGRVISNYRHSDLIYNPSY